MNKLPPHLLCLLCLNVSLCSGYEPDSLTSESPPVHTFSIVAFDPDTGDVGVAVASKVLGVGSVVPYAKAGVGAIATQAYASAAYGIEGLKLLDAGYPPEKILEIIRKIDPYADERQVGIVSVDGKSAAWTGPRCIEFAGNLTQNHFSIQGNLLLDKTVLEAMKKAYTTERDSRTGELADWLLAALEAGEKAGGDKRGKQSAAILVARKGAGYGGDDRYVDLRVDDHKTPVQELKRLYDLHIKFHAAAHRNRPKVKLEPEPKPEE